jgi:hypothetical protein
MSVGLEDPGRALQTSSLARLGELLAVFAFPTAAVLIGEPLVGEDPLAHQALVWVANVGMLLLVWGGLRLRGQSWSHLGLRLHRPGQAPSCSAWRTSTGASWASCRRPSWAWRSGSPTWRSGATSES